MPVPSPPWRPLSRYIHQLARATRQPPTIGLHTPPSLIFISSSYRKEPSHKDRSPQTAWSQEPPTPAGSSQAKWSAGTWPFRARKPVGREAITALPSTLRTTLLNIQLNRRKQGCHLWEETLRLINKSSSNGGRGFPGGSDGKESACNVGDPGSIPGSGRSPGERKGNPLQYSCLENPVDRGA